MLPLSTSFLQLTMGNLELNASVNRNSSIGISASKLSSKSQKCLFHAAALHLPHAHHHMFKLVNTRFLIIPTHTVPRMRYSHHVSYRHHHGTSTIWAVDTGYAPKSVQVSGICESVMGRWSWWFIYLDRRGYLILETEDWSTKSWLHIGISMR